MPFDPTTAKPADAAPADKGAFDPATAKPVDSPRWDVVGDVKKAVGGAVQGLTEDFSAAFPSMEERHKANQAGILPSLAQTGSQFVGTAKLPFDALGVATSPATGVARATAGSALSYLPGVTKKQADEGIDEALLGAKPKSGPATAGLARGANIKPAAVMARDAGYVLPPEMATDKPGVVSSVMAGWSGKEKLRQLASEKNQKVTTDLATKALGLAPGTPLNEATFSAVRAKAGQAYQAVIKAVPTTRITEKFRNAISALGDRTSQAAQYFPDIFHNEQITKVSDALLANQEVPTQAMLDVVKTLRFQATANLKAIGDPQKHAAGLAMRQAADAIDSLIEQNLESEAAVSTKVLGPVVKLYREARQLIAKSYDVEGATNTSTGEVSAQGLGRLKDKGRPLSGELDTIADVANAFTKGVQDPERFGGTAAFSPFDFFGAVGAGATGHYGAVGAVLGRPVARAAVLSRPYQSRLIAPKPRQFPQSAQMPAVPPILPAPDYRDTNDALNNRTPADAALNR